LRCWPVGAQHQQDEKELILQDVNAKT